METPPILRDKQKLNVLDMASPDHLRNSRCKAFSRLLLILGLAIGVTAVVVGGGIAFVFYQIDRSTQKLDDVALLRANYQPAALDLVKLCQSDQSFFTDDTKGFDPAWAPPSIRGLHPEWIDVSADHASVTWGGGFYHCGWELTRQPAADTASAHGWTLSFTRESSVVRVLQSFTVPIDSRYTLDQLVDQTVKELARRAGSESFGHIVADRISFMLSHGLDEDARQSVARCAVQYPQDWCDQLLLYLLRQQSDSASADAALRAWVHRQDGFDRWILAAHAFARAGRLPELRDAVMHAVAKPIADDLDAPGNARHLGAPICLELYDRGSYALCVRLCDALAAYDNGSGNGATYLQPELARIKAAALSAASSSGPAPAVPVSRTDMFDPFEHIDLSRLLNVSSTQPSGPH